MTDITTKTIVANIINTTPTIKASVISDTPTFKANVVLMGADGKEVEFQTTATHIQWRYVDGTWADLVALADLKGADGTNGIDGDDGNGIASITRTSGTGAAGTTDTYTITFDDLTTTTFDVYNGADGIGAGDMLKSVYDTNGNNIVDNAEKVNNHTVEADVPSGAVFTDTVTTVSGNTGAIVKADITALGIPAQDTVYVHPNHSGDVTSVADGAQTIANGAVTLAKMADVATKTLLGRATAGTGAPEVLSIGTGFTVGASSIKVNVLDMLIADDTDKALSAKQGKVLNTTKANIASPALTGTPTAPTAATGTDTTQIASTEFVQQELDVHKAEKPTQVLIVTRDLTISGSQVITGLNQGKKPYCVEITITHAGAKSFSQGMWHDNGNIQYCRKLYTDGGTVYYGSNSARIIEFNDTQNRAAHATITSVSETEIALNWNLIGTISYTVDMYIVCHYH